MSAIQLIVGLGNPELKYANTRHNAGCDFITDLAKRFSIELKQSSRFPARSGKGEIHNQQVRLAIPLINMNDSGRAIAPMLRYFKIPPKALLVVYDELDLSLGQVRLKGGGSAGGHNGIKDVAKALGVNTFWRLRIGIGRPAPHGKATADAILNYVLRRAPKAEQAILNATGHFVVEHLEDIVNGRMSKAMNLLHSPPKRED